MFHHKGSRRVSPFAVARGEVALQRDVGVRREGDIGKGHRHGVCADGDCLLVGIGDEIGGEDFLVCGDTLHFIL